MAKTTTCAFCGKELTTGFFKGNAQTLLIGYHDTTCCQECYDKYSKDVERVKERLKIKLANHETSTKNKKIDGKFLADTIVRYLDEEKAQIERCGMITNASNRFYFAADEKNGYFAVREFDIGGEVTLNRTIKSIDKMEDVGDVWFSKDDITRLEYRINPYADVMRMFYAVYSFQIRLNDEKVITYKPCITRATFGARGLFPHTIKKKILQQCEDMLQSLKDITGADVPIVRVKKFR